MIDDEIRAKQIALVILLIVRLIKSIFCDLPTKSLFKMEGFYLGIRDLYSTNCLIDSNWY